MQDDDWMLPRRLHVSQGEGPDTPTGEGVSIDPQFLQRRALRKRRLGLFPTKNNDERPWSDFDRSIARSFPSFGDQMWTLGDTARWVIERTPEAVNGLSVDEDKLFEALPEIQGAFVSGEIPVFGNTQNDPVPRELPVATWSIFDLAVEEKNGLVRIFPSSSSANYEQQLFNIRVKRADVLERWPDRSDKPTGVQTTTAGAQNQCRLWLTDMMKKDPGRPRPKSEVRREALDKFQSLSGRGFDRAWDAAVANAPKWAAPGRRS
jgi:hypothetical protein